MTVSGILNLSKPTGVSSRQVVDQVQRLVRKTKTGHAGTLDPLATGVLIVCLGEATRMIEYVQRMPKRYRGTFLLGRESDTEDITGDVKRIESPPQPGREELEQAAKNFVGEIEQRPPAFSALKVGGKRAYQLARKGREVQLEPRPVHIYTLQVLRYEYPEVELDIQCSGGTYVRSLGRDLAQSLGTVGVMSALVRTGIGDFRVEDSVAPDQLTSSNLPENLLPMEAALGDMPSIEVSEDEIERLFQGSFIARAEALAVPELAALDTAGHLVSILVPRGPETWGPSRNFKQRSRS